MDMYHSQTRFYALIPAALAAILSSCTLPEAAPGSSSLTCYSYPIQLVGNEPDAASYYNMEELDIFTFEDDPQGDLDCYSKAVCKAGFLYISSTSGNKKVVVARGMDAGSLSFNNMSSYDNLTKVVSSIYDEDLSCPHLAGECRFTAGPLVRASMPLEPLLCRIRVKSITTDFSSRPYRDKKLENVRVYLTNVNALCTYTKEAEAPATEILNYGGFDENVLARITCPEMIIHEGMDGPFDLYCYPNNSSMDGTAGGIGAPPTRLVIEGSIDGHTCYYPITIADGKLKRGLCYSFDIELTRSGGTDPDIPIETDYVNFTCSITDWYDSDEEYEDF